MVTGNPCFVAIRTMRERIFRDLAKPRVYLTGDYWVTQTAYETFLRREEGEYKRIDAAAEDLTVVERHVGSYETIEKNSPVIGR